MVEQTRAQWCGGDLPWYDDPCAAAVAMLGSTLGLGGLGFAIALATGSHPVLAMLGAGVGAVATVEAFLIGRYRGGFR